MMAVVAAILVIAVTLIAVTYPFLRRPHSVPWLGESEAAALREFFEQRDTLYRAIQQLDFDKELGNLDEEDHRQLRAQYVRRAAAVLREIDARERDLTEEIEREVAALVRGRAREE